MKLLLFFACAGISLLALNAATANQSEDQEACQFKVSDSTMKPAITGPEDIVAMSYVLEQPDSPIEILGMDFKDSFISVSDERYTEQLRCTAKIRNRSDHRIRGFNLSVHVVEVGTGGFSGTGTLGPGPGNGLAPGQEIEVEVCGGGHGRGGAPGNRVHVLVSVDAVGIGECSYLAGWASASQG